ncbi:MAG: hypothetical protein H7230_00820, partial [Candidatus Parcubacteria bacterium]|nr:hypothetical protein [Candidatus Paceibacterota bacterium]
MNYIKNQALACVKSIGNITKYLAMTAIVVAQVATMLHIPVGNAAGVFTGKLVVGRKDIGTAMELSACIQNTGSVAQLADVSLWYSLQGYDPATSIAEEGRFTGNPAVAGNSPLYDLQWAQVQPVNNVPPIWGMKLVYAGAATNTTIAPISSTALELYQKVILPKQVGYNPNVMVNGVPTTLPQSVPIYTPTADGVNFFEVGGNAIAMAITEVVGDCRGTVVTPVITATDSKPANSTTPVLTMNSTPTVTGTGTAGDTIKLLDGTNTTP